MPFGGLQVNQELAERLPPLPKLRRWRVFKYRDGHFIALERLSIIGWQNIDQKFLFDEDTSVDSLVAEAEAIVRRLNPRKVEVDSEYTGVYR